MKCQIQWIGCHGHPTPDSNDAIGYATHIETGKRYAICKAHLATMNRAHANPECRHGSPYGASVWEFDAFETSGVNAPVE